MKLKTLLEYFTPRNRKLGWLSFALVCVVLVVGIGELAAMTALKNLSMAVDSDLELQNLSLRLVTQRFKHIPYTSGQMDDVAVLLRNPNDSALNRRVDIYLSSLNRRLDAEALYLMNDRGICIASSNWNSRGSFKGDDYAFRSYFKEARAGGIGFDYAIGTTSCTPGLFYASPVKIGDGIYGVMAIKVTLDEISKIWSQASNPLFLLDRHGIVILSSKTNYLYTATRKLEGDELKEIQAARTYGSGNCASGAEFKATPWTIRDSDRIGGQVMSTAIDGKKSDFLIKKLYLSEFDWTLVATANMASVSHSRWIAMTITFLNLLAMTLGVLYWRQREKRVEDLRRGSVLLEQRVQDRTRDLAERDAFRKAMEDALLVGMRARDLEGNVTYVNPALCDITGFSTEEMLDKSPPYVYWYPDETEPHVKAGPVLTNESATLHGYDTRFRHKDGHELFVTIYDAPLIDANGHHSGWMSSIVDISLQRQMESRQRVQDEQLRQVQRRAVIEEMASTLAHEISQPLMIIGASNEAAKLFIDQGNTASLKNSLEMIALQKQRAANIIKTIRDHTRMKTKGDELCNVNDIVDGVIVFLRAEVRRRKAHIKKSFATNLPPVVADRVLLEQVLVNLVMNGLQAMQDNPVNQRLIEIETAFAEGFVSVRVHDLGSGVSPEVAGNLFKSFFTTKEDGLGMGLNICRTIIESHGGQLAFENRPERGTTFYFSIPSNP